MTGPPRYKLIIAIVISALGAIIVLQNFQSVDTMVFFWRMTLPHIALLGIVFGCGIALGSVLTVMWYRRQWVSGGAT